MTVEGIDLCAGPGGWDVACEQLGWHVIGVEWDDAACATRLAAGLRTIQGDIAALSPREVAYGLPGRSCEVLIASPPCTTFSMAGKGVGRTVLPELAQALHTVAAAPAGTSIADARSRLVQRLTEAGADKEDAFTTSLVLEPMRWLRDLDPEMLAMEQVPPVLPLWDTFVRILRDDLGWRSAWTGVINSADVGVPQTRRRAVVIASRDRVVQPPRMTHCKGGAEPDLFGEGLLPWVSMASALGWGNGGATPSPTVTSGGTGSGGGVEVFAGADARERVADEAARVGFARRADSGEATEDGYRARDLRSVDEPAQAVTETARSWTVTAGRAWKKGGSREDAQTIDASEEPAAGNWKWKPPEPPEPAPEGFRWVLHETVGPNTVSASKAEYHQHPGEEPAPVIREKMRSAEWRLVPAEGWAERGWSEPAPTVVTTRRSRDGMIVGRQLPSGENEAVGGWDDRTPDCPCDMLGVKTGVRSTAHRNDESGMCEWFEWLTPEGKPRINDQSGEGFDPSWVDERPSATVASRDLVGHPGATSNQFNDSEKSRNDGIRITVQEAAILQSFPPDYPWTGSRTKQFEQVGNAVPCLLALRVLEAVSAGRVDQ